MIRTQPGWIVVLCAAIAALVAIAAGAGVFLRGDLATTPFVTVRGETIDLLTDGTYRFNSKVIAAEGVGWDLVTLFLVVPAFIATLPFLRRGSLRARLIAIGILVYFLYQYLEYATFLAYGPLFPVYVAIVGLSLSLIAILAGGLDVANLPARFDSRFPRRGVIALAATIPLLLGGMWAPLVARTLDKDVVPELAGGTTLVVQAFDLGLLVPLGVFTAVTVFRRLPVGFVLASIVAVKAAAMGTAIAAMLVVEGFATGIWQWPPIVLFAAIGVVGVALGTRVVSSVVEPGARSAAPAGPPAVHARPHGAGAG